MVKVDEKVFWSRARQIWKSLNQGRENAVSSFNKVDALLVWTDKNASEDTFADPEYAKSAMVSLAVLDGYEFTETLFLFTQTGLVIVASEKKIKMIEPCKGKDPGEGGVKLNLELLIRSKDPAEWGELCSKIAEFCKKSYKGSRVASLINKPDQSFGNLLSRAIQGAGLEFAPHGLEAVEESLSHKDAKALQAIKDACKKVASVSETFRKHTVPSLDESPSTHEAVTKKMDAMFKDDDKDLDTANVTAVQSGTKPGDFNFDLRGWKSPNPKGNVTLDVISFRGGVVCKSFLSLVARTIFISPTSFQKDVYMLALEMREAIVNAMKPGAKPSQVYRAASDIVAQQSKVPQSSFVADRVGFAIGHGFCETDSLAAGNDRPIIAGSTYVVEVRLENLIVDPTKEDNKVFSCWLADVVYVESASGAQILTENAHAEWSKNHFRIEVDEEEEGEDGGADKKKKKREDSALDDMPSTRRTTRQQARGHDSRDHNQQDTAKLNEEAMAKRQGERIMRRQEDALRKAGQFDLEDGMIALDDEARKGKMVSAYSSSKDFSPDWKRDRIFIDLRKETVLLPIGDRLVPFHMATIKTIGKTDETDSSSLKFNFHFPSSGGGVTKDMSPEMQAAVELYPNLAYVKELTFKSRDVQQVNKLYQTMKDLQKKMRDKLKKDSEEKGLVEQAALILLRDRPKELPATLSDVSMLPTLAAKSQRCLGRLRAHVNGFRFSAEKQGEVDILYSNVKYFFFQRGEKESKVLIHFYLRNPIMIGKKKTRHVQFFTEVAEGGVDLGGRGENRYDRDELDDEERQRRLVQKLNKMFAQFCKQSLEIAKMNNDTIGEDNEIEVSNTEQTRQGGFFGQTFKEMVLIQPTEHCLVNLTDKDFFVLPADEIEHIHFERVSIGKSKNFDVVFVLKSQVVLDGSGDNIKVAKIDAVQMGDMDKVRKWIDDHDPLTYTMGQGILNWDEVLKQVRYEMSEGIFWKEEDLDGEKKDIGWMFLNPNAADEEDDEEEDEDSSYGSDSDSDEGGGGEDDDDDDDYDEDDDLGSVVDEDDDDDDDGEVDSEDEGEDWDELERKAEKEDRVRTKKLDEGDERVKKKMKKSKDE